mmetsp:Transcript_17082/g.37653  ORF Transcript_17082/g.37653 Transcript_17082/m.37653 type:complete len:299 (-) Transcript_17082:2949-3845(-)
MSHRLHVIRGAIRHLSYLETDSGPNNSVSSGRIRRKAGAVQKGVHRGQPRPGRHIRRQRRRSRRRSAPTRPVAIHHHNAVVVVVQIVSGDLQGGLLVGCDYIVDTHIRAVGDRHSTHRLGSCRPIPRIAVKIIHVLGHNGRNRREITGLPVIHPVLRTSGRVLQGGRPNPTIVVGVVSAGRRESVGRGCQQPAPGLGLVHGIPYALCIPNGASLLVVVLARLPQPRVVQTPRLCVSIITALQALAEAISPGATVDALVPTQIGFETSDSHLVAPGLGLVELVTVEVVPKPGGGGGNVL